MSTVTVGQLKEALEKFEDDEALVFIAFQENYPFEASVRGIISRQALHEAEDQDDSPEDIQEHDLETLEDLQARRNDWAAHPHRERWGKPAYEFPETEAIIVMGDQVCYGDKRSWELV